MLIFHKAQLRCQECFIEQEQCFAKFNKVQLCIEYSHFNFVNNTTWNFHTFVNNFTCNCIITVAKNLLARQRNEWNLSLRDSHELYR